MGNGEIISQAEDLPKKSVIIGFESARGALAAIQKMNNATLQLLIQNTTVPLDKDFLPPVYTCEKCPTGAVHVVGRNRLPDGRLGMSGLTICDCCADVTRRR